MSCCPAALARLSAAPADVRRCLEEALDAPSVTGPPFASGTAASSSSPGTHLHSSSASPCTRSGKSTLASVLAEALGASKTAVIRQDRFASKVLAAQVEGGWESTDSIDFKAFLDAVVEASKSKHFVIVEGFRKPASGGVVDLLHHLVWIELSREACYERRMATMRVLGPGVRPPPVASARRSLAELLRQGLGPMPQLVLDGSQPPTLLLRQLLVALGLPAPARRATARAANERRGSVVRRLAQKAARGARRGRAGHERGRGDVARLALPRGARARCPLSRRGGYYSAWRPAWPPGAARAGGAVLGLISLNGSSYVDRNLRRRARRR